MGIEPYDLIMAAVITFGAAAGYVSGITKMLRPVINLIISRYLFKFVLAGFTGMNEIKELIRKMMEAGVGKLVVNGSIPASVAEKLAGSKHVITAGEMFATYVASIAAFGVTYVVVRLLIGLVIGTVKSPKHKALYMLDKTAGFTAGALLAVALLVVAFMIITSMAYVGSPWAGGMLAEIHKTVIFRYAMKFI